MKFLLVLVAVLGLTAGDDVDGVNYFLHCAYKAIVDGIPSIPVPQHNPTVVRNVSFEQDELLYKLSFNLTNNLIFDLLNLNMTKLDVKSLSNPERVNIDYNLYWPLLNITGDFAVYFKTLVNKVDLSGSYNILLHHVNWYGVADYVKPGQENVKTEVDKFSLASNVKDVEVTLTEFTGSGAVAFSIKEGLVWLFNHFPAQAAEILRTKRFNEFWIGHPQYIQAVFDHCAEDDSPSYL